MNVMRSLWRLEGGREGGVGTGAWWTLGRPCPQGVGSGWGAGLQTLLGSGNPLTPWLTASLEPPEPCDSVSHLCTGGGRGGTWGQGAVRTEMQLWGQHPV